MQLLAHIALAFERLRHLHSAWLVLAVFCLLGPGLENFGANAPIKDHLPGLQPWLQLAGLAGALIGIHLIKDTETVRRASTNRAIGDFILISVPALLATLAALLSVWLVRVNSAELESYVIPWLPTIAGTLHIAALASLLRPLGPLVLVGVTWLLPALLPMSSLSLFTPLAEAATPVLATVLFTSALLLFSTPHALRSPR